MGYGLEALRVMGSLKSLGEFEGYRSVVELGSQDIHLSHSQATNFIQGLTCVKLPDEVSVTLETFYKCMGFESYKCIDTDGRNNALVFDLNKDIVQTYNFSEQFDLVTNHGTTEHCFDQAANFRNIHNLCKTGGIMFHALPCHGFLNHGLFAYQPNFFKYLAEANNYRIIGMWLYEDPSDKIRVYSDKLIRNLTCNRTSYLQIVIYVALKKMSGADFRNLFDQIYVDPREL